MKNAAIFFILFLAVGIYGIYYYLTAVNKLKEMGFIEGRGTVLSFTEPEQRFKSSSTVDWYRVVKIIHEGREHIVKIHAGTGYQVPEEIGKEIPILINTKDINMSETGDYKKYYQGGIMVTAAGFIGAVISGVIFYLRFTKN